MANFPETKTNQYNPLSGYSISGQEFKEAVAELIPDDGRIKFTEERRRCVNDGSLADEDQILRSYTVYVVRYEKRQKSAVA